MFGWGTGDMGGDDHLHPVFRDESGNGAVDRPGGGHCIHHVCARHVSPAAGPAAARDAARAPAAHPTPADPHRRLSQVRTPLPEFLHRGGNVTIKGVISHETQCRVSGLSGRAALWVRCCALPMQTPFDQGSREISAPFLHRPAGCLREFNVSFGTGNSGPPGKGRAVLALFLCQQGSKGFKEVMMTRQGVWIQVAKGAW